MLQVPHFGLPSEGKAWWCVAYAKAHAGAVDVYKLNRMQK
jgi:hypothetical protein